MLLKNHLTHEPPEGYFEQTLWPSVTERMDQGEPAGGGNDVEFVFKSTPAMATLNVPQRQPPRESAPGSAPTAPMEAQGSPWRWPVALMVSAAIGVVGYLAYKKMNPPPPVMTVASATPSDPGGESQGTPTEVRQDAALQVAALTTGDAGGTPTPGTAGEPSTAQEPTADSPSRRHHGKRPRHHRGEEEKGNPATADPTAGAEVAKPAKPAKSEDPRPTPTGKKTALDNLLDDAIGSAPDPTAKKAAAAAPKEAASDLPDQLNMNQIRDTMNRVKARVQACYDQFQVEGMANVQFTIRGEGSINDVSIRGKFRGTDTGDCVVKAVKTAHFPKFRGKPMTIKNYPFLLQ